MSCGTTSWKTWLNNLSWKVVVQGGHAIMFGLAQRFICLDSLLDDLISAKKPARPGEFIKLKKKVVDLDATVLCWEPVQGCPQNLSMYLFLHSIKVHICGVWMSCKSPLQVSLLPHLSWYVGRRQNLWERMTLIYILRDIVAPYLLLLIEMYIARTSK